MRSVESVSMIWIGHFVVWLHCLIWLVLHYLISHIERFVMFHTRSIPWFEQSHHPSALFYASYNAIKRSVIGTESESNNQISNQSTYHLRNSSTVFGDLADALINLSSAVQRRHFSVTQVDMFDRTISQSINQPCDQPSFSSGSFFQSKSSCSEEASSSRASEKTRRKSSR